MDMVYYSPLIDQVQSYLPNQFYDKFQDRLLEKFNDPSRRQTFDELLNFLDYVIQRYGSALNKQSTSSLIQQAKKPSEAPAEQKSEYKPDNRKKYRNYFAAENHADNDNLIYKCEEGHGGRDVESDDNPASDIEDNLAEDDRIILTSNYVKPKSIKCCLCDDFHESL